MGKAFPYPVSRGLVLCPVSAVSRRSVTLGQERPSEAFPCSVQGSDTPLRWSLLFAFSAPAFVGSRSSQVRTQSRTGHRARRSCLRARPMDVQGLCTMGVMWPRIGRNALAIVRGGDCTRSLTGLPSSWGFAFWAITIACWHRNSPKRCCIAVSKSIRVSELIPATAG